MHASQSHCEGGPRMLTHGGCMRSAFSRMHEHAEESTLLCLCNPWTAHTQPAAFRQHRPRIRRRQSHINRHQLHDSARARRTQKRPPARKSATAPLAPTEACGVLSPTPPAADLPFLTTHPCLHTLVHARARRPPGPAPAAQVQHWHSSERLGSRLPTLLTCSNNSNCCCGTAQAPPPQHKPYKHRHTPLHSLAQDNDPSH